MYTKFPSVTITIQLAREFADAVRHKDRSAQRLFDLLRLHQLRLEPFDDNPTAKSPLATFFQIIVENPETGNKVMSLLQQMAGVEAAYVKPAEAAP